MHQTVVCQPLNNYYKEEEHQPGETGYSYRSRGCWVQLIDFIWYHESICLQSFYRNSPQALEMFPDRILVAHHATQENLLRCG